MAIVVTLDVMLARRKLQSRVVANLLGVSEQNLSLLKRGHVRGMRLSTLSRLCAILECQPGDLLQYLPDGPGQGPEADHAFD